MRKCSIHITESDLVKVLEKLIKVYDYQISIKDAATLAERIAHGSKGYALNSRSISVTNDKLKRDTNKVTMAGRDTTAIFVSLLFLCRRKLKHRGLIAPKPGSPDWLNYKEATKLATEFCNEYGFQAKEGFLKYIEIGMTKMVNFSIYKFKQLHEAIYKEYDAQQKIQNDRYAPDTSRAHSYYVTLVSERIGFCQGFDKNSEKYACFIDAVKTAKEFGIDPKTYIKAQFAGFDWRSGIPDPLQLTGIKAIERLQNYCFENQILLGKSKQNKTVNFSKIKKASK